MKATNEARCVFYQRDWSVEELEAGECDAGNKASREEYNLTLLEHDATEREKRIWIKALEFAKKKEWVL